MKDSIFWRFILPDLNHLDTVHNGCEHNECEFLVNWVADLKLETGIDPSNGG